MDLATFKPTFHIQIEGRTLSKDITQEIKSFVFEDHEALLDTLVLTITNRNLQFVDHPLFQEGNEIVARWGYLDTLSPRKKAVIKEISYDFPENGEPTIQIKALDKGFMLSGKENQKVWQKPVPGILHSDIAEMIAQANGLKPVVQISKVPHLRVAQSNQSDAAFLKELAVKTRAKDGDGVTGYVFFVQDDELHFHPRRLEKAPVMVLTYHTDQTGVLRSFQVSTHGQGAKGEGAETKAIGIDPRKKQIVQHVANNASTPLRTSLGKRTYLMDGNTGEGTYQEQETGHVVPSFERSEGFHEELAQEPGQDLAEGRFKNAELRQVKATARTIGIPTLKAKQNLEIGGIGQKFSGIYYCFAVRHILGADGYSCELTLRKNALGVGAGDKSGAAKGQINDKTAPPTPKETPVEMVTVNADTGSVVLETGARS